MSRQHTHLIFGFGPELDPLPRNCEAERELVGGAPEDLFAEAEGLIRESMNSPMKLITAQNASETIESLRGLLVSDIVPTQDKYIRMA